MIGRNAIATGQRDLQTAAQRCAMYRRNEGLGHCRQTIQQLLSATRQRCACFGRRDTPQLLDVGTGNPGVGLAAHQHRAHDRGILLDAREDLLEHRPHARVQRVHWRVGLVVANRRHAIVHRQRHAGNGVFHQQVSHARSTIMA